MSRAQLNLFDTLSDKFQKKLKKITHKNPKTKKDTLSLKGWLLSYNSLDEEPLTNKNVYNKVIGFTHMFLDNYDLPGRTEIKFDRLRNASYIDNTFEELDSADVALNIEFQTLSGLKIRGEMTVPVKEGKFIEPSLLFIDGNSRIISQSTFDDITKKGTFTRHLFKNPEDIVTPEMLKSYQEIDYPVINTGMYSASKYIMDKVAENYLDKTVDDRIQLIKYGTPELNTVNKYALIYENKIAETNQNWNYDDLYDYVVAGLKKEGMSIDSFEINRLISKVLFRSNQDTYKEVKAEKKQAEEEQKDYSIVSPEETEEIPLMYYFYEYLEHKILDENNNYIAGYQLVIWQGNNYIVTLQPDIVADKIASGDLTLNWEQDAYNADEQSPEVWEDYKKKISNKVSQINEEDIMITPTREGFLFEYRTPEDIVIKKHYVGYEEEEMMTMFLDYIKEEEQKYFWNKAPKVSMKELLADNTEKKEGNKESKTSYLVMDEKAKKQLSNLYRDVDKAKNKLKKTPIVENFGQDEVEKLKDKYRDYLLYEEIDRAIQSFDDWASGYTGKEAVAEGSKITLEVLSADANKSEAVFSELQKAVEEIKRKNPKGWLESWESRRDTIALEIAEKLNLYFEERNNTLYFWDKMLGEDYDALKTEEYTKKESNSGKEAENQIEFYKFKKATGEPDQDYNHAFFDEIVRQLEEAGFTGATHKEFDKYQGVYLRVPGVDKFWIKDVFYRGEKTEEDVKKPYTKATLIDIEGNTWSASKGDYFHLPNDYLFEGYVLELTKQDGTTDTIENPTVGQLPDITEVGTTFTYKPGTETEIYVFTPENTYEDASVELEVTNKDGVVDASELIEYCKPFADEPGTTRIAPEDVDKYKESNKKYAFKERQSKTKQAEVDIVPSYQEWAHKVTGRKINIDNIVGFDAGTAIVYFHDPKTGKHFQYAKNHFLQAYKYIGKTKQADAIDFNLEDWFLVGNGFDSGQDDLWDFSDPYGLLRISPPHIQGEKGFIEEIKGLYHTEELAYEIIEALNENRERQIEGDEKDTVLKELDKYWKEETGRTYFLKNKATLVVYQLYGKDKEANTTEGKNQVKSKIVQDMIDYFIKGYTSKEERRLADLMGQVWVKEPGKDYYPKLSELAMNNEAWLNDPSSMTEDEIKDFEAQFISIVGDSQNYSYAEELIDNKQPKIESVKIKSETEYRTLLAEVEKLISLDPEPETKEGKRLDLLASQVEDYEKKNFPITSEEKEASKKQAEVSDEEIMDDVIKNFKKITGQDISTIFDFYQEESEGFFFQDELDKSYPKIREYVQDTYGIDIEKDEDFLYKFDDKLGLVFDTVYKPKEKESGYISEDRTEGRPPTKDSLAGGSSEELNDAIVGDKEELKWVYGTKDETWHLVSPEDRDYAEGISQEEFKELGEERAKEKYLSPTVLKGEKNDEEEEEFENTYCIDCGKEEWIDEQTQLCEECYKRERHQFINPKESKNTKQAEEYWPKKWHGEIPFNWEEFKRKLYTIGEQSYEEGMDVHEWLDETKNVLNMLYERQALPHVPKMHVDNIVDFIMGVAHAHALSTWGGEAYGFWDKPKASKKAEEETELSIPAFVETYMMEEENSDKDIITHGEDWLLAKEQETNKAIYAYGFDDAGYYEYNLLSEVGEPWQEVFKNAIKENSLTVELFEDEKNYYETLIDAVILSSNKQALWKDKLQNVYESLEEFKSYNEMYGLIERLGFGTAEEAWEANPMIQGTVHPEDYKVVEEEGK